MDSIGERLRLERLRQGRDIEQVARQTRINARHLEAIENDELGNLPGKFFYRSFVKQYARALGIDEGEFEAEFPEALKPNERTEPEIQAFGRAPIEVPPMPSLGGRRSSSSALPMSLILLVAAIVGASGLYSLWQKIQQPEQTAVEAPPPAAPSSTPPAASDVGFAGQESARQAPSPESAQGTPGAGAEGSQPQTAVPAPAASPDPAMPAPVKPPPEGSGTLELTATDEVWVQITAGGETLLSRTLQPGQSRVLNVPQGGKMIIGNAGGLDAKWNGQPVGALGPSGQVRVFTLSRQGFQAGSASQPPPQQTPPPQQEPPPSQQPPPPSQQQPPPQSPPPTPQQQQP